MSVPALSAFLLSLALLASASGAREDYVNHCNARFAFCLDVPAGLKEMPPPENDDGRTWRGSTGAEIRVWGMWNAAEETLGEACDFDASEIDSVVLRTTKKDWCVVSGFRKGRIVYERRQLAQGRWVVFQLEYQDKDRPLFDGKIGRMAKSLKVFEMPDAP